MQYDEFNIIIYTYQNNRTVRVSRLRSKPRLPLAAAGRAPSLRQLCKSHLLARPV